jgi:hypothetical protein
LEEEKATLEGMVESRNVLIMEIVRETRLDHMGEYTDDKAEDEDVDNGGYTATPPIPAPSAATPEEVVEEEDPVEMVPEQEAHVAQEVILADVEPKMSQPRLYHVLMRDYVDSQPRMIEDLDDLDDDPTEACSDINEWFPKDGSNDRD